jgi:DNA-binding transcriptional ArsR family regulator
MELDYRTVKALSSSTRIKILNELLEGESTPTSLSDEIGKSKSTIASHLATLVDSGLVEKDEREGRRRVVYRPTRKARTIVQGRERKVRFSLTSAVLSGIVGAGAVWKAFSSSQVEQVSSGMEMMDADAATNTVQEGGTELLATNELYFIAFLAGLVSLLAVAYGGLIYRLTR